MDTNNPAELSNEDLENDMEQKNREAKQAGNQEHVNKSSAAEGELISPEQDPASAPKVDSQGFIVDEDSQDGSMPDPEALDTWEADDDPDKISG
jgi:hypothetical protein